MKLKFACPHCGQTINVNATIAGKRGRCPGCNEKIQLPSLEQFEAAANKARAKVEKPLVAPNQVGDDLDPLATEPSWDDLGVDSEPHTAVSPLAVGGSTSPPAATGTGVKAATLTARSYLQTILGVLLMVAVLPASLGCWIVASRMSASNQWPTCPGRIVSSHVEEVRLGPKVKYQAQVRYHYEVKRRPYLGSEIRYGDTTGSARSAQQKLVDKYPAGSQVDVYYDPDSPDTAVLEPGGTPLLMTIPPVALLGIGGYLFLRGRAGKG